MCRFNATVIKVKSHIGPTVAKFSANGQVKTKIQKQLKIKQLNFGMLANANQTELS